LRPTGRLCPPIVNAPELLYSCRRGLIPKNRLSAGELHIVNKFRRGSTWVPKNKVLLHHKKPFLTLLPLAPTPLRGFSATPTPFPGVKILNLLTVGSFRARYVDWQEFRIQPRIIRPFGSFCREEWIKRRYSAARRHHGQSGQKRYTGLFVNSSV
jgi:hypothetical protein